MNVWTETRGLEVVHRRFQRLQAGAVALIANALQQYGDALVSWMRANDSNLFKRRELPDDEIGTNEVTTGGMTLSESLWTDPVQIVGSTAILEGGWGVMYGRIMEFGPREKGPKKIYPKNLKTDGTPIKALRVRTPEGVKYRKWSTYAWKSSMLRPHWKKAIAANRGRFTKLMKGALRGH